MMLVVTVNKENWRFIKKKLIARKEVCLEKNVPIKEIFKKESEHQTCVKCV